MAEITEQKNENNGSNVMKGSIVDSYEFDILEKDFVHFMVQDWGSPRPKDLNEKFDPEKRVVKMAPHDFVMTFAGNYIGGDIFKEVSTPCDIVAIQKNLTKEIVKSEYSEEIASASRGNNKAAAKMVEKIYNDKKKLKVAGSSLICVKVMHIPNTDQFPFVKVDKFPKKCLHSS